MTVLNTDEDEFELENAGGRTRWALTLGLAAGLSLILLAFLLTRLGLHTVSGNHIVRETPRSAYLDIMSETNTGLRLARLVDYRKTYPNSRYSQYVNAQYAALKVFEERDWATYTRVRFDPQTDQDMINRALKSYVQHWGVYQRQAQITHLNSEQIGDDKISFAAPRSKYAQADTGVQEVPANLLVGDTVGRGQRVAMVRSVPARTQRPSVSHKLRVKYAPKPRYPSKARRKHIPAMVTLSLDIDAAGRVARAHVVEVRADKYHKKFARAARYAARRSRFYPRTVSGRPVAVSGYKRTYKFEIPQ
ncbi:MAG TPA: TonB family protein [Hellea balneolensis]|uniref:TonB family protein n=1 Tax=Hellea balneolensis TaxID=287478 RepID=A0A7C5M3C6_9PROT|nr:TonB family protein [Hellea balneolensis]